MSSTHSLTHSLAGGVQAPAAAGVLKEHYGAGLANKTVVDIGGSEGAVLKAIKAVEPTVKAINFDR